MSCTIKIHVSYAICCHILSFNTTILPLLAIFPMYADIIPSIFETHEESYIHMCKIINNYVVNDIAFCVLFQEMPILYTELNQR